MISWGIKISSLGLSWLVGTSALVIKRFEAYPSDRVVFGNYNGYISPEVLQELKTQYSILPDYFSHDHVVKEKFYKGTYDVAVVSTSVLEELKNSGLSKEIDWKKFGLKNNGSSDISSNKDAKELFTDVVKEILGDDAELLKYGIPYFLNKLSFCYRGSKIEDISNSSSKVSWKTLIQKISEDSRFKNTNSKPKLALIDDPRTVLSLSRLADSKTTVNPGSGEYSDTESIFKAYSVLSSEGLNEKKLGRNFLFIDPNSSTLLDSLASGDVNGAFMYNGDCLYAASGGNLGEEIESNDFHVAEVSEDIYFLDFITFSSKLEGSRLENAYKFSRELLFTGYDQTDPLEKEDEDYKYTSVRNFDFVQYTPVLDKHLEKIKNSYFESSDQLKNTKESILKIDKPSDGKQIKNYYETSFQTQTKNDMLVAFEKFKLNS